MVRICKRRGEYITRLKKKCREAGSDAALDSIVRQIVTPRNRIACFLRENPDLITEFSLERFKLVDRLGWETVQYVSWIRELNAA